jgi:flagellar export protein FliJ
MADLESLIRLRRHTVEEKQKVLSDIYQKVEALENQKSELLNRLNTERKALDENLTLETSAYYGRFEAVIRRNVELINNDLSTLETRLEIAQEDVRRAFEEMKRVEIVHERRKDEERQLIDKKESQELDAIGIDGFMRASEE